MDVEPPPIETMTENMNLVVGATGILGLEICRQLAGAGKPVTALIRASSAPARIRLLESAGVQIRIGDLKDTASIEAACRGVANVITTASSTLSRSHGDSIETVDRAGQLNLVRAAAAAGAQRFVYVSFPESRLDFPLQQAKRDVEAAIRESGVAHAILHPTHFWEVWFSPALGFDPANGKAVVFGDGRGPLAWISLLDVRDAVLAAVEHPELTSLTTILGGPESVGQAEVLDRFDAAMGRKLERVAIKLATLQEDYEQAQDPLLKSFAALKLIPATGEWAFPEAGADTSLLPRRRSIDEHIHATVAGLQGQ